MLRGIKNTKIIRLHQIIPPKNNSVFIDVYSTKINFGSNMSVPTTLPRTQISNLQVNKNFKTNNNI